MEEIELSWLHPLPLCTSVVVQQKKFDVMRIAEISPGKHSWKEARQRDSGRILQAEHRAQEKHKQYRLV